ncbi:MAG: chromate transporter [Prevotella sp.]|nr:chromate transporter [Prevotella sp.]
MHDSGLRKILRIKVFVLDKFYITSFKTFFKIGIFTLGGGYAMIPIIEAEVVEKKKWLTKEDFIDTVAIAQSSPGVFAINLSVFIGYKMKRVKGALVTALGTALPSFLIILLIAMFFRHAQDNPVVAAMFRGIRPAVVALIAVPTFNMAKSANIGWSNCWIPIASALAIWALGVSPIIIIILAAIGGYVYGKYLRN